MPKKCFQQLWWADGDKLGQGEYGVVFKGYLLTNASQAIAVKTVKAGAEKSVILALLSELKVMIYLERHPNIVGLFGACTEFLREGRVYLLLEYCPLGSLQSYLRKVDKHSFLATSLASSGANVTEDNDLIYESVDCLTTKDLVGWAIQIARGMQHLQSRKVIHGDLATRNVLLYSKAHAKITDFGLSRQLVNYDTYVKKSQDKLPWRWMAIETLQSLEFTHKTDVWSYGVILWEIFTLGLVPYAGMRWNDDFMAYLEQDLRLSQPRFASDKIYRTMVRCWAGDPGSRPDFRELEALFLNLTEVK